MPSPLDLALRYALEGRWPILPVYNAIGGVCTCPLAEKCGSPAKHPIGVLVRNGGNGATTDEATIRRWWSLRPLANVAIAMGSASGMLALDVDAGTPGAERIAEMIATHGPLDTLTARTGGGGTHYLFRFDSALRARLAAEGREIANRAGIMERGIDVRAERMVKGKLHRGYILAAPSVHVSGGEYQWINADTPPAKLPPWLYELLSRPIGVERTAAPVVDVAGRDSKQARYAAKVLDSAVVKIANAAEGARHGTIRAMARTLGGYVASGWIGRDEAERTLIAAAEAAGKSGRDAWGPVKWGLDNGEALPIAPELRGSTRPPRDLTPPEDASIAWADDPGPVPDDWTPPGDPGDPDDWRSALPDINPDGGRGGLTAAELEAAPADDEAPAVDLGPAVDLPWARMEPGWLTEAPPERRYVLHDRPKDDRADAAGELGVGVLPRGIVALLAAAGGTGKTFALVALALSVVSGKRWLGCYRPGRDMFGRAVLILGEEPEIEVRRRIHTVASAMDIRWSPDLAERLLILPGAGLSTLALTQAEERGIAASTPFAASLRAYLEAAAGPGWDAVIIDPLSRFAGPDVEKDNAAATRLIQVLESLVNLPGKPAVVVAHHTKKPGMKGERKDAGDIRGASALVDGARWAAMLERLPEVPGLERGHLRLSFVKGNYGPDLPERLLTRGMNGPIYVSTERERLERDDALKKAADAAAKTTGRKRRKDERDDEPDDDDDDTGPS